MSVQRGYYPIIEMKQDGLDLQKEEVIEVKLGKDGPERRLLTTMNLIDKIHPSWFPILLNKSFQINERLKEIYSTAYTYSFTITPKIEDTFNVFSMPVDQIKVVMIGQDPYPGFDKKTKEPIANGYAFATCSEECPGSLEKLLGAVGAVNRVRQEEGNNNPYELRGWINQGVLLLNNTLTFMAPRSMGEIKLPKRIEQAKGRAKELWSPITLEICKFIVSKNDKVKFLLFGTEAHDVGRHLPHAILLPHPSPRSNVPFDGSFFRDVKVIQWNQL
jgi:uracil-DNA glycosylase